MNMRPLHHLDQLRHQASEQHPHRLQQDGQHDAHRRKTPQQANQQPAQTQIERDVAEDQNTQLGQFEYVIADPNHSAIP